MVEKIHAYSDRYGKDYKKHLKKVIENLRDPEYLKRNIIEYSKIELKRKTTVKRAPDPNEYKGYVRIFFNGMSCRTLLGRTDPKPSKNSIAYIFREFLMDKKYIEELNNIHKIRLKIRFLFPYIYSDFVYSMTEGQEVAQAVEDDGRPFNYDFNIENKGKINKKFIKKSSRIANEQEQTLKILNSILEKNDLLKITSHDYTLNSLQIRYTAAPLYLCSLIINNEAFCDPYLLAKEDSNSITPLSHRFPVINLVSKKGDRKENKFSHFEFVRKHMGTLWSCDTSIFCSDVLNNFDEHKNIIYVDGKSAFKLPNKIDWKRKIVRIKQRMKDAKIKAASQEVVANWLEYSKSNLLLHTSKCFGNRPKNENLYNETNGKLITLANGVSFERPKNLDPKFDFKNSFFQLRKDDNQFELFLFFKEENFVIFKLCRATEKPSSCVMVFFHIAMLLKEKEEYEYSKKVKIKSYNGIEGLKTRFSNQINKLNLKSGKREVLDNILQNHYFPITVNNILIDESIKKDNNYMMKLGDFLDDIKGKERKEKLEKKRKAD